MVNPVLQTLPRHARRAVLDKEGSRRRSGQWPPWSKLSPLDLAGFKLTYTQPGNWVRECHAVFLNDVFSVFVRNVPVGNGNVLHLAITSMSGDRPTFHEMMRIKNEMTGPDKTGVEVYPPEAEVVDGADMYHLWVLPGDLPFSLWKGKPDA